MFNRLRTIKCKRTISYTHMESLTMYIHMHQEVETPEDRSELGSVTQGTASRVRDTGVVRTRCLDGTSVADAG